MISDVLYDAILEIDELANSHPAYSKDAEHIEAIQTIMQGLRIYLLTEGSPDPAVQDQRKMLRAVFSYIRYMSVSKTIDEIIRLLSSVTEPHEQDAEDKALLDDLANLEE